MLVWAELTWLAGYDWIVIDSLSRSEMVYGLVNYGSVVFG